MSDRPSRLSAACRCGRTVLDCTGDPLVTAVCYCSGCQAAGRALEAACAPPTLTPDGGTVYCMYRKDRVTVARGREHLREAHLPPEARSRRVVAACCATPMFVEANGGHWLSLFQGRLGPCPPAPQLRNFTADRPEGPPLPTDLPNYRGLAPPLVARLLGAWVAMGFRRPKFGC